MTTDRDVEMLTEQREVIAAWYDSLTDKQRQAVRLCWIEGYTQQEAAEGLGITHQAVADRLATAKLLAKRLAK